MDQHEINKELEEEKRCECGGFSAVCGAPEVEVGVCRWVKSAIAEKNGVCYDMSGQNGASGQIFSR